MAPFQSQQNAQKFISFLCNKPNQKVTSRLNSTYQFTLSQTGIRILLVFNSKYYFKKITFNYPLIIAITIHKRHINNINTSQF